MRSRAGLACAAALAIAGCGREREPSQQACAEILATRLPAARVVAAAADATTAALEFEVGAWWRDAARGRLACSFEAQPGRGLRLRAATLDGVAFTSSELLVANVDLLLAEMRRSAGPPD